MMLVRTCILCMWISWQCHHFKILVNGSWKILVFIFPSSSIHIGTTYMISRHTHLEPRGTLDGPGPRETVQQNGAILLVERCKLDRRSFDEGPRPRKRQSEVSYMAWFCKKTLTVPTKEWNSNESSCFGGLGARGRDMLTFNFECENNMMSHYIEEVHAWK